MRIASFVLALVASFFVVMPSVAATTHPTNAQGYVTDGSPQNDDAHCVGSTLQQVACRLARRAGCRHLPYMTRQEASDCWVPEIAVYQWDQMGMFDALYCESKGNEDAINGRYRSLFQSDDAPGDAISAFEDAYYNKWLPAGGGSPWRGTYYTYCPS